LYSCSARDASAECGKIRGERKLGKEWKERPKNPGTRTQLVGRGVIGGALSEPPIDAPTLAELGLERKRAARDVTFSDIEDEPPKEGGNLRNTQVIRGTYSASRIVARLKRDRPNPASFRIAQAETRIQGKHHHSIRMMSKDRST
jgi:hypothetical protein